MDKPTIITEQDAAEAWQLPLAAFYEALRANGFSVTVTQIAQANRIIVQYANQVKNLTELGYYLSPVFVSDAEEQTIFQDVFNQFFKKEVPQQTVQPKRAPRNWKWLIAMYAVAVLAILMGLLLYQKYLKRPPRARDIALKLIDVRQPKEKLWNNEPLQIQAGQRLQLRCTIDSAESNMKRLTNRDVRVSVRYNWGVDGPVDTTGLYQYDWPGKYLIKVTATVWYQEQRIKEEAFEQTIVVCDGKNSLRIANRPPSDSVPLNRAITLQAITNPELHGESVQWYVNDEPTTTKGHLFTTSFKNAGTHTIGCKANFGGKTNFCTLTETVTFYVVDGKARINKDSLLPNVADSITPATGILPESNQPYNPILKQLYYTTLVLFALLAIFFFIKWEKERKNALRIKQEVADSYNQLMAPGSDESPTAPRPLPYKNKNHVAVVEPELREIALQMRKRIHDTVSFLDTEKTIRKSIEMAGFFQPVYGSRTKQQEYLFLIQDKNPDRPMAKLQAYLIDMLAKQNVLIEKYYYQDTIDKCYQPGLPTGVRLEKLAEKYASYTLLIFGDGAALLKSTDGSSDGSYWSMLERWQYRALVTPLSYADWGKREKETLLLQLPVFPMDLPGLQLLFERLSDHGQGQDGAALLVAQRQRFYPAANLAWDEYQVLERYCDGADWAKQWERGKPENILFQWVAALAVCPRIEWEVILAIGKAILGKYGLPKELNYTNLLRVVRIDWVNKGVCPPALRIALLQQLKPANEAVARAAMLELLQAIQVRELADDASLLEEREIQRITHEFSLYVHDPSYYASYRESSYVFERLWRAGKIKDAPLVAYYKNEAGGWQTLLGQGDAPDGNGRNIGIETYFESEHQEASIMTKVYLYLCIISVAGAVFSYFSLLLLRIWEG